jgi:Ala-tRNA(Pro) deacylase
MLTSPEDHIAYLAALSIEVETVEPLHTVEDSQALRGDIPGGHTKNLFVKDKESNLFLLVLGETTVVDLKRVHEKIGAGTCFLRLGRLTGRGLGRAPGRGDAIRRT